MTSVVKGNGSIRQREAGKPRSRCRKWQLRVNVGLDPLTGKYAQRSREFSGTYTEAKAALREFVEEVESGRAVPRSGTTLREYVGAWCEARRASGNYSPRTVRNERDKLEGILLHLGGSRLGRLSPKDVEAAYARLRAGESVSGRPLSGKTLNNIHKSLTTVLKAAERDGLVKAGTAAAISAPKPDSRERPALSPAEVSSVVSRIDPSKSMHLAVALCVLAGLRRSEALALTWADWDGSGVSVDKSLGDGGETMPTKSAAGRRYVPCPDQLNAILRRAMGFQRLAFGDGWRDSLPVAGNDGAFYRPHSASHWWRVHREGDFGVSCTLHDLRHSYITMLAEAGVHPKTMQILAGHASPELTLSVYTHVQDRQRKEAAESLGSLLESEKGGLDRRPSWTNTPLRSN